MAREKRVALVLGAIKGIGKAIGLDLARRGIRVGLNYFDWESSLPQMQADFAALGTDHAIFRNDLTDCQAARRLVQEAVQRFGRLDILINNIERGGWPIVHGPYQPEQWDLEFATTLRAKQWVFDTALPFLKDGGNGAVINFSSIAAVVGRSGPASLVFNDGYAAAQRGIGTLTETWSRLAAPEVRVNEIMLGFFETRHGPDTRGWGLLDQDQRRAPGRPHPRGPHRPAGRCNPRGLVCIERCALYDRQCLAPGRWVCIGRRQDGPHAARGAVICKVASPEIPLEGNQSLM
jgi:3-oxoacyl-[acyl-carrier protein] reductase